MVAYKGFTEAQARAHKEYMKGVATIQVRTDAEQRERIKAHAGANGESVNAFILRAITETMQRDAETRAGGSSAAGQGGD